MSHLDRPRLVFSGTFAAAPSTVNNDPLNYDPARANGRGATEPMEGGDHYRIASAGRDGKFAQADLKDYRPIEFAPGEYDSDIVYGDDAFIARPQAR